MCTATTTRAHVYCTRLLFLLLFVCLLFVCIQDTFRFPVREARGTHSAVQLRLSGACKAAVRVPTLLEVSWHRHCGALWGNGTLTHTREEIRARPTFPWEAWPDA